MTADNSNPTFQPCPSDVPAAALWWASQGVRVFPVSITPDPDRPGHYAKRPLTQHGFHDATRDVEQITRWWKDNPAAGIGIADGEVYVPLDEDGPGVVQAMEKTLGPLPPTWEFRTPSGGRRLMFLKPDGAPVPRTIKWHGTRLDIMGAGGYSVVPPSAGYTWTVEPTDTQPCEAFTDRWQEALPRDTQTTDDGATGTADAAPRASSGPMPEEIPAGERETDMMSVAGAMRRKGCKSPEIFAALQAINARCQPPLSEKALRRMSRSVCRYAAADAAVGREYTLLEKANHCTEAGMGARLARLYGDRVRYNVTGTPSPYWHFWDGIAWQKDLGAVEVMRLAKEVVLTLLDELKGALKDGKKEVAEALEKARKSLFSAAKLGGIIKCAQSERGIHVQSSAFDADPEILNFENCTVDLRTGKAMTHNPARMCSFTARAEFHEGARHPEFDAFLQGVTSGDDELRDMLQLVFGAAATGYADAKQAFFFYGVTDTGKTTLIQIVATILDEYATETEVKMLTVGKNDGQNIRSDVAKLAGKRLAVASEHTPNDGREFDVGLFKKLTANEPLPIQRKYKEAETTRMTATLVFSMNHLPRITVADPAIWNRIRVVPFSHVFCGKSKDPFWRERMLTDPAFRSAAAAWFVEGARKYLKNHDIPAPKCVFEATKQYRRKSDFLFDWWEERINLTGNKQDAIEASAAFADFQQYAKERGLTLAPTNVFKSAMEARGAEHGHHKVTRRAMFFGIRFASDTPPNDPDPKATEGHIQKPFSNSESKEGFIGRPFGAFGGGSEGCDDPPPPDPPNHPDGVPETADATETQYSIADDTAPEEAKQTSICSVEFNDPPPIPDNPAGGTPQTDPPPPSPGTRQTGMDGSPPTAASGQTGPLTSAEDALRRSMAWLDDRDDTPDDTDAPDDDLAAGYDASLERCDR